MKIILKILVFFLLIVFFLITYLSTIGIETKRFNSNIQTKVKEIDKDLILELREVKLKLNPINFKINAKTLGSKLIFKNNQIEIENIKTNISLKSLLKGEFLIEKLEISSKPINIKNTFSILKSFYKSPQLILLDKILKIKGYLIADIKLEFDHKGNLKNNYIVKGSFKDTEINLLQEYYIDNLNFKFDIIKNDFFFNDIRFRFNDINFSSKNISAKKKANHYLIKGNFDNDSIGLSDTKLILFEKVFFPNLNLKQIDFSSNSIFSLDINEKFQIMNYEINSKVKVDKLKIKKKFDLKEVFPEISDEIILLNNHINFALKKDFLKFSGEGDVIFQNEIDQLAYSFEKKNKEILFQNNLRIKKNPFRLSFLNYEKNKKKEATIKISGLIDKNKQTFLDMVSLDEGDNKIEIEKIYLNKKFRINSLYKADLNYLDKDNKKNIIKIINEDNIYILKGEYFNAKKLIQTIIENEKSNNYFDKNLEIKLNIKNVLLGDKFELFDLIGNLKFKGQELLSGSLSGNFRDEKKMKFTVNSLNNEKITTFFIAYAEPIIKNYKFIKGFEEGTLDFYSSKRGNISNSTLKIYNFKLKELPTLTKILTLASLQGIADILSGEGIRFDEFEMNFKNENDLMTIREVYAIGPAISILMDGYIEKNKLISLRGTLVPATTINKVIGSIPILGKILVGSKTGEGVFGVSFKIKGSPKNLETTVNPIKTLTPRFITRTLEKIKKTN